MGQAQRNGFTLVEMLVGITLMSLLLGVFGNEFLSLRKTAASVVRTEQAESLDVIRRFIRQGLAESRNLSQSAGGGTRAAFAGGASRLSFTRVSQGEHDVGGIYEVSLWQDAAGRIMLQLRPLGWGPSLPVRTEVLLENVQKLAFSYLPCPLPHDQAAVQHWTDSARLPYMVSVDVRFRPGDARRWPRLSVFLPASACPFAS